MLSIIQMPFVGFQFTFSNLHGNIQQTVDPGTGAANGFYKGNA